MWVYQEETAPLAGDTAAAAEKRMPPRASENAPAQPPARPPRRSSGGQAARDCACFAAAYLIGTSAAGVLQALCDEGGQQTLAYFLQCWCALLSPADTRSILALFGAQYAAAALAASVLLFLGLSALGPAPLFLFAMLYGVGAGLLASQLYAGLAAKTLAVYLLAGGVPLAVITGALCSFGASALQVCSRLQAFSLAPQGAALPAAGARRLLGQYVLLMTLLVPLCGAATGLATLAARWHLW